MVGRLWLADWLRVRLEEGSLGVLLGSPIILQDQVVSPREKTS